MATPKVLSKAQVNKDLGSTTGNFRQDGFMNDKNIIYWIEQQKQKQIKRIETTKKTLVNFVVEKFQRKSHQV